MLPFDPPWVEAFEREAARWAESLPFGDQHTPPGTERLERAAGVPAFGGDVVVPVDAGTFSSGEMIAVDLHDNGCGVFVDEPTGCGGSGPGEVVRFPFPEFGAELHIGCRFWERPGIDQGSVKPHVFVPETLADFRAGRDAAMEYALRAAV